MMCPREDNLGYVSTGGFSKLECGIMQKFEKKRGVLPNFSVIFAHRAQIFRQFFEFFRQIFSSGDGRRQTIEPDEKMKKFDEKN